MSKYVYPAIFKPEEKGYSIEFPDLEGCYTCGESLEEGLEMARDVLALVLYGYEKEGRVIPEPSERETIHITGQEFVNYVICDTMAHRNRAHLRRLRCGARRAALYAGKVRLQR